MTAAPLDPAVGLKRYDDEEPRRELDIRCHPEAATWYDVNYLVSRIDRLAADLAAAQAKLDRVEALAQRSAMLRVQISAHQITAALAGAGGD